MYSSDSFNSVVRRNATTRDSIEQNVIQILGGNDFRPPGTGLRDIRERGGA